MEGCNNLGMVRKGMGCREGWKMERRVMIQGWKESCRGEQEGSNVDCYWE
jgi:hypothetical protein